MTIRYRLIDTPVDEIWLAWGDEGLVSLGFAGQQKGQRIDSRWRHDPRLECPAIDQVREYFGGQRRAFDLPLAPRGTAFQLRVWNELARIPFGATTTYGEIAQRIGRPSASRAVGAANGRNPIAIVLPCHRVIGRNGKLTGFAGGLERKEKLLRFEQDQLELGLSPPSLTEASSSSSIHAMKST